MKTYLVRLLLLLFVSVNQIAASDVESLGVSTAKISDTAVMAEESEDGFDEDFNDEYTSDEEEISDPLEGYNRWMTSVNDTLYLYLLDPLARGYSVVMPQPVRIGVSNAVNNLKFPIYFVNNILQLKGEGSARELARFMINSTIGLLGLIDVATKIGIKPSREDFGQTLGYWGIGSGFHLVIPLLGPSNLRDFFAGGVDGAISPLSYTGASYQIPNNIEESVGIKAVETVNAVSLHLGEYQSLKKDALDWYLFLRNAYEEKRSKEINE